MTNRIHISFSDPHWLRIEAWRGCDPETKFLDGLMVGTITWRCDTTGRLSAVKAEVIEFVTLLTGWADDEFEVIE